MSEARNVAASPPQEDRVHYYMTGRVLPKYQAWAEKDIESRNWTRREWIRVLVFIVLIWLLSVLGGARPFRWSLLLAWGSFAIVFLATMPWRRKIALRRMRKKPLPAPTAAGLPNVPTQKAPEEGQPDPMQSFYAKGRN